VPRINQTQNLTFHLSQNEKGVNYQGFFSGKIVTWLKKTGRQINWFFKRVGQFFDNLIYKKSSNKQLSIKNSNLKLQNTVNQVAVAQIIEEPGVDEASKSRVSDPKKAIPELPPAVLKLHQQKLKQVIDNQTPISSASSLSNGKSVANQSSNELLNALNRRRSKIEGKPNNDIAPPSPSPVKTKPVEQQPPNELFNVLNKRRALVESKNNHALKSPQQQFSNQVPQTPASSSTKPAAKAPSSQSIEKHTDVLPSQQQLNDQASPALPSPPPPPPVCLLSGDAPNLSKDKKAFLELKKQETNILTDAFKKRRAGLKDEDEANRLPPQAHNQAPMSANVQPPEAAKPPMVQDLLSEINKGNFNLKHIDDTTNDKKVVINPKVVFNPLANLKDSIRIIENPAKKNPYIDDSSDDDEWEP